MFIGHFAVALAAKRLAPRTSLGTLFAAAQLPDLIWPIPVLLGVESRPLCHSSTDDLPEGFAPLFASAISIAARAPHRIAVESTLTQLSQPARTSAQVT